MRGFGYLFKEGLRSVWNNRLMSVASVCVLVSCLVLTGAAVLFSQNVTQIVEAIEGQNEVKVFLEDDVTKVEAAYIGKEIEEIENIASATFYSKEEALEGYKDYLGEDTFEYMEKGNPLPDAYIIKMKDLSQYRATVDKILSIDGVTGMDEKAELADKLTSINNLVSTLSLWIVLVLAIISLFIVSNTVRATTHNRRFEISIMKSVGATNAFVRIPFIVEGIAIGVIAAVLATVVLGFLYVGVMEFVAHIISVSFIPLSSVIGYVAISNLIAGVVIGALSGFISIRKYLKKEGNEVLGW